MLNGQYSSKLTEGNRISVPKRIREELGDDLVVAKWYEGCSVLVSKLYWQDLLKRLIGRGRIITSPVRDIDRFIFGSAYELEMDLQGRFVLPETLKVYARLISEVTFIGLGDRVELWSRERWIEIEKQAEIKASLAIEKIAGRKE